MQNQYFCYYYIKLAEAWITLNSKVTWTCQIKVSIGNVFGCNHQGCNRSNLVMARYARPRSHIPHCPHPRVVTGWQVSTHWVTDASHITTHCHPSSETSNGFISGVPSPVKEEIFQDMRNVVWSSLCGVPWSPHSVPLVTIVCFSLQRLGSELWDPRLRVNGPGPAVKPGPGRNLVPAAGIESVECCCWEID